MHQFVQQDVLTDEGGYEDEPPVECDRSARRARAPARTLIANRHARHINGVNGRKIEELSRQVARGLLAVPPIDDRPHHARRGRPLPAGAICPLVGDPARTGLDKRQRVALGAPARQRHPNRAIIEHAHDEAPRTAMADEHHASLGGVRVEKLELHRC